MDQNEEIRYLLLAIQREGNRQFTEALKPLGLTPAQAEVMVVLHQYQPMTLLQLGERLVCETGSPSRLVSAMVKAGRVQKLPNPDDGRAVLLSLTPESEATMPQLHAIEKQFNQQTGAFITGALRDTILQQLWSFVDGTPAGEAVRLRKSGE